MSKSYYRLVTFGPGSTELVKKEKGMLYSLAYQQDGIWELSPKDHPSRKTIPGKCSEREITEEEATMILFQCEESV